jgi:hypothetical protein
VLGGSKAGYNPVSPLVDSPTLGLNLVETSGGVGHNTFNPLPTCLVGLIPLRGSQADVSVRNLTLEELPPNLKGFHAHHSGLSVKNAALAHNHHGYGSLFVKASGY